MTPDDTGPTLPSRGPAHAARPEPPAPGPRYAAQRHLASGARGDVFVARDAEVPRQVALKRIQERHRHDPRVRDDFLREARLAGRLEHPGIVPVYGLLTEAPHGPAYAMRLIGGETLRATAERLHASGTPGERFASLEFRQLLGRLVAVCRAVQYAHSRGVIHRDIKPDNIMLGDFGETYVVDWGLAKPFGLSREPGGPDAGAGLWAESGPTASQTGDIRGTLAYMPPEQAAGRVHELDPACDVYALGATLFFVLTGTHPGGSLDAPAFLDELARGRIPAARDRLSAVPRALDAVCRRAMAPEPKDRYPSAEALAAEVERWLAGEPVAAYWEPPLRRLARWGRRRPAALAGAGATLAVGALALAVGLAVLSGKNAELRASESRAAARYAIAREAVETYLSRVTQNPVLQRGNFHQLRKELLRAAVPFYERLNADAAEAPAEEAAARQRLGDIARDTGDAAAAEAAYRGAAAARRRLLEARPDGPELRFDLAAALNNLGLVLSSRGDRAGAAAELGAARDLFAGLAESHPENPEFRHQLANVRHNLGLEHSHANDGAAAEAEWRAALALRSRLVAERPGEPEYRSGLSKSHHLLGGRLRDRGDRAGAEREFRAALALTAPAAASAEPRHRADLATSRSDLAGVLADGGDVAGAAREYRAALDLWRALAAEQPDALEHRAALAGTQEQFAHFLTRSGEPAKAEAELRAALALLRELSAADPARLAYRNAVASVHNNLANLLGDRGDLAGAAAEYRAALPHRRELAAAHPDAPAYRLQLGGLLCNLGHLARDTGDPAGSLAPFAEALDALDAAARLDPPSPKPRQFRRNALWGRAESLLALSRPADAVADLDAAVACNPDAGAAGPLEERRAAARFALAAEHARHARAAACLEQLARAEAAGHFRDPAARRQLLAHPSLDPVRREPAFRALLERVAPAERLPVPRGPDFSARRRNARAWAWEGRDGQDASQVFAP